MKIVTERPDEPFAEHAAAQDAGKRLAIRLLWGGLLLAAVKGLALLF